MQSLRIEELSGADLPVVAALHIKAFKESALSGLGQEAVERYYEWQLKGPHDAWTVGVYDDDRMVGFCFAGVFRGAMGGFLRKHRGFLIKRMATHPQLFLNPMVRQAMAEGLRTMRRFRKQPAPTGTPAPGYFSILSIAVDPEVQGKGAGRALMEAAEGVARDRGFPEMKLTVNVTNSQAIRFYENLGWVHRLEDGSWKGAMKKDLVANV